MRRLLASGHSVFDVTVYRIHCLVRSLDCLSLAGLGALFRRSLFRSGAGRVSALGTLSDHKPGIDCQDGQHNGTKDDGDEPEENPQRSATLEQFQQKCEAALRLELR
jgi:hypothetical protein